MGVRMAEFPLSPMFAKMLLESGNFGCSKEIVTIAAMMQIQNIFVVPPNQKKAAVSENRLSKRSMLYIWQKCFVSVTIIPFFFFAISPCRPESTGNLQLRRETTSPCWMCMKHSLRYGMCTNICAAYSSVGDGDYNTLGLRTQQKVRGKSWLRSKPFPLSCSTRRAPSGVRNTSSIIKVCSGLWQYESSSGVSWTSLRCRGLQVKVCMCHVYFL